MLEAQSIKLKTSGEDVFAEVPMVQTEAEFLTTSLQKAEKKDWLAQIWDKWPGDEPIAELLSDLKG